MLELLFGPIVAELVKIREEVVQIRRLLAVLVIPVPGPLKPVLKAEEENGMLVYEVEFPPKPATPADLVTQRFGVTVGEVVVFSEDYNMDVTKSAEFKVNDNDHVTLSLAYIDDAGNVGASKLQEFDAHDTIPPDMPGDFGAVTLLREE